MEAIVRQTLPAAQPDPTAGSADIEPEPVARTANAVET